MKKLAAILILAAIASIAAPGCATAAKETIGAVRGAKGIFAPIQPVGSLAEYNRFEIGELTDGFGGKVPPDLLPGLEEEFAKQLAEREIPNELSGKTLVVRGTIFHYEDADLLGFAVGPLEEVIVRAELVDKDSGKVLGTANCIGRTTNRINKGIGKKREGLAKAFAEWIEANYPKQD